jgi:hypothetical protein
MGEWKTIKEKREQEAEQYLEDEGLGADARQPPGLLPPQNGQGDSKRRRKPSA